MGILSNVKKWYHNYYIDLTQEAPKMSDVFKVEAVFEQTEKQKEQHTCNECTAQDTCEYAWDNYNTNGDCLASK